MFLDLLFLALGIAGLVGGGEVLVRGATSIAKHLGVAPLIIGLTVVAFGTSAPELALNMAAAASGNSGLAFGNIVGSNIANIGLILGLAALVTPLQLNSSLVRRELPLLLVASVGLILLTWLPPQVGDLAGLTRSESIVLLLAFAGFMTVMISEARNSRVEAKELIGAAGFATGETQAQADSSSGRVRLTAPIVSVVIGLVLLVVGAELAKQGAVNIARHFGVSEEVIGLTLVAVATSLPELVTSLVAAVRGHADLAVGNVVGSNLFNILFVMGASGSLRPLVAGPEAAESLITMLVFALALVPLALTRSRLLGRWSGLALLVGYGGYLLHLLAVI